MSAIRLPRLIKPDVLAEMKPSSVRELLLPFSDYFECRGVRLFEAGPDGFDFDRLYEVLASPTESTPPDLIERLELLDLIGCSECALHFEAEYHEVVAPLRADDDTTADLAVKILLHAPEIAHREYDRQVLKGLRSLVSFRPAGELPFHQINDARIQEFEEIVSAWFEQNGRGGTCRLQHRQVPGGKGFVIHHGDLLKRFDVLDDAGNAATTVMRRERVDVAHFREATGELQISGIGAKVRELYRETFGLVFHGSKTALAPAQRYSLEPLRQGPQALECGEEDPVRRAELKSLKLELSGEQRLTIEKRVFVTLGALNLLALPDLTLVEARIDLKLRSRRSAVRLKICPKRDTILGETGIPVVEDWLVARGFAQTNRHDCALLASA